MTDYFMAEEISKKVADDIMKWNYTKPCLLCSEDEVLNGLCLEHLKYLSNERY